MIFRILWNSSFTLEAICSLFTCFKIIYTLEFDTFKFCFLKYNCYLKIFDFKLSYHRFSTRKLQGSFSLHHDSLWWFDFVAFLHASFFATHHGPGTFLFYPSRLCFIVRFFWPWKFSLSIVLSNYFSQKGGRVRDHSGYKLTFSIFRGEHNWLVKFDSSVESLLIWNEFPLATKIEQMLFQFWRNMEWWDASFGEKCLVIGGA